MCWGHSPGQLRMEDSSGRPWGAAQPRRRGPAAGTLGSPSPAGAPCRGSGHRPARSCQSCSLAPSPPGASVEDRSGPCVFIYLNPDSLNHPPCRHLRDVRGPRKENQPARPCCPTGPDRMMKRDFTRTSTRELVQAMSVTCYSDRLSPRKVGWPRRGDSLRCASVRPVPPPLNESSSLSCTVSCCG